MKRSKEVCNEILSRNLDIHWCIRTRTDRINYDLLKLMKKAGCKRINFGAESGNQESLLTIKKGINLENIREAFRLCKEVKIESLAYFMLGIPGETKEQMLQTIKFAKKLNPSFCHFSVFTPYPETRIWRNLMFRGNTHISDVWKKYVEAPTTNFNPPTCNEFLSKKELFEMCNLAYKSFYFRPKYMIKEIIKVGSFKEFARKTKAAMKILSI